MTDADAVLPDELSEQDMQTVNGGADLYEIHEIPHIGRVTSTGSTFVSSSSLHAFGSPSSPNKTFGERFGEFANTEFGRTGIAGTVGLSTAISAYSIVHAIKKNKHPDTQA